MSKKRIIIIIVVGIFLIGLIVLAILYSNKTSNQAATNTVTTPAVTLHTNPDTGEQITNDPSLGKSESQDATTFNVYGLANFITQTDIFQAQIDFIKTQLAAYNEQNFNNKYTDMTIRPQDLVVAYKSDYATSTLRLGESNILVNFKLMGISTGNMQLFITDPTGKNGGNYTSPVTSVFND